MAPQCFAQGSHDVEASPHPGLPPRPTPILLQCVSTQEPLLDADDHTRPVDGDAGKNRPIMAGLSHDFQWLLTEITK